MAQAQAQEIEIEELTEPVESDIVSLEESPDGETHVVVGADGSEHVTGVFPPFDSTTFASQLMWLAIAFGLLYVLMSRLALPRIGSILEDRRSRIEGDLAEADRLRHETDKAIEAYETALAEARSRAHGIAEETRVALKADIDARRAAVEADLAGKVAAAELRIGETKAAALENVDAVAAETAAAVVDRLVGQVSQETARAAVAKVSGS